MASPPVHPEVAMSPYDAKDAEEEEKEENALSSGAQLHWGVVLTVTIATIVYNIIGGLIFRAIEKPYEMEQYNKAMVYFNDTIRTINVTSREELVNLTMDLKKNVLPYVEFVDGKMKVKDEWNFFRAVLFASTVFTTIGYGNVTPRTPLGRWAVIMYAVIGIPLFVFTMAALASKMYGLMEWLPYQIDRCRCLRHRKHKAVVLTMYSVVGLLVFIILPMIVFAHTETWTYGESLYFAFVTLSTIGLGDYVPQHQYGKSGVYLMSVVIYIAFGLAWLSGLVAAVSDWWSVRYTRAYDKVRSRMRSRIQNMRRGHSKSSGSSSHGEAKRSFERSIHAEPQRPV